MLERIQSGEHILAFNVFSSYARAKQKKDKSLEIVFPKDYTLVMSRIAVLPKVARHPNAGKVFLDFLLSQDGQEIIARKSDLFSIRAGVTGEFTQGRLQQELGDRLRPIPVGPQLLGALDPAKRLSFLKQWQETVHPAAK